MENLNINIEEEFLEFHKYYLIKENIVYEIEIGKTLKGILIKTKKYMTIINLNKLTILTKNTFDSIDKAYDFVINIFDENKIYIKHIEINKLIKLEINDGNLKTEIGLLYNENVKANTNYFMNEINKLKNDIKNLKEENNKLKKNIETLKKYHDNRDPKNIQLLSDVTYDGFAEDNSDNSFTVFNSINNILCIIYTNKRKSLVCYNLNTKKKISEVINAHNTFITCYRYYLDKINKRDIVLSLSCNDNNIKLWNVLNWECILNLIDVNISGSIYSACFMEENNKSYFITSNCNWNNYCQKLKIYDFDGQKVNEINDSNYNVFFIDTYYDKKLLKNYIVTGNFGLVKSYDYNKNELYYDYKSCDEKCHLSLIVQRFEDIVKLIESSTDGNIRIWDFHSGLLLNKIKISNSIYLRGICLFYNNNYLLVSCDDKTIKIIELRSKLIVKSLVGHDNKVLTIKKVMHPQYGECILSQGYEKDQIKIWTNFMDNDIKWFY